MILFFATLLQDWCNNPKCSPKNSMSNVPYSGFTFRISLLWDKHLHSHRRESCISARQWFFSHHLSNYCCCSFFCHLCLCTFSHLAHSPRSDWQTLADPNRFWLSDMSRLYLTLDHWNSRMLNEKFIVSLRGCTLKGHLLGHEVNASWIPADELSSVREDLLNIRRHSEIPCS